MELPSPETRLPLAFYERRTETVARDLLGKSLVRKVQGEHVGGIIVETEAYLSTDDPASHSARGHTPSNAAMFGRAGTLYVYPIHAKYCMNVVTCDVGQGSAVLIRAIEPIWGITRMKKRRSNNDERKLTRGPAMLCQALAVDRKMDHADLLSCPDLWIADGNSASWKTGVSPRIGISKATERLLRFFVDGNRFVSGRAGDHRDRPNQRLHATDDTD